MPEGHYIRSLRTLPEFQLESVAVAYRDMQNERHVIELDISNVHTDLTYYLRNIASKNTSVFDDPEKHIKAAVHSLVNSQLSKFPIFQELLEHDDIFGVVIKTYTFRK